MRLTAHALTHTGRRTNNEDAHCIAPDLGLCVVADGMGGYEGGEVASALAVEAIRSFVEQNNADVEVTWPRALRPTRSPGENIVTTAIALAHRSVVEHKSGKLAQMGTTVAMWLRQGDQAIIGHVGDSRIYRLRQGKLSLLTEDHSLVNALLRSGAARIRDPRQHPYAHVITRALGFERRNSSPDVCVLSMEPGDRYMLCTDGLTERLNDAQLRDLLLEVTAREAPEALVKHAYDAGSRDNITAVVLEVSQA